MTDTATDQTQPKRGPGRPRKNPLPEPKPQELPYEPSLDEVLQLNWKTQPLGKKHHLRKRLAVVSSWIDTYAPDITALEQRLSSAPIDAATSRQRMELIESQDKLKSANRAQKILQRELARRGGDA